MIIIKSEQNRYQLNYSRLGMKNIKKKLKTKTRNKLTQVDDQYFSVLNPVKLKNSNSSKLNFIMRTVFQKIPRAVFSISKTKVVTH